jgi:hypothetical protein
MFALLTEQVEEIQSDVGGIGDNNLVRVSSVIVKSFNVSKPVAKPVLRDRNVSTSRYSRARAAAIPSRPSFATQTGGSSGLKLLRFLQNLSPSPAAIATWHLVSIFFEINTNAASM